MCKGMSVLQGHVAAGPLTSSSPLLLRKILCASEVSASATIAIQHNENSKVVGASFSAKIETNKLVVELLLKSRKKLLVGHIGNP
jgi:hypothetical protein